MLSENNSMHPTSQPPAVLKASGNLSERETMETEVISEFHVIASIVYCS